MQCTSLNRHTSRPPTLFSSHMRIELLHTNKKWGSINRRAVKQCLLYIRLWVVGLLSGVYRIQWNFATYWLIFAWFFFAAQNSAKVVNGDIDDREKSLTTLESITKEIEGHCRECSSLSPYSRMWVLTRLICSFSLKSGLCLIQSLRRNITWSKCSVVPDFYQDLELHRNVNWLRAWD